MRSKKVGCWSWFCFPWFLCGFLGQAQGNEPGQILVAIIDPRPIRSPANRKTDLLLLEDSPQYAALLTETVEQTPGFLPLGVRRMKELLGFYYRVDMFRCSENKRCVVKRATKLARNGVSLLLLSRFAYSADRKRVYFHLEAIDLEQERVMARASRWFKRDPEKLRSGIMDLTKSVLEQVQGGAEPRVLAKDLQKKPKDPKARPKTEPKDPIVKAQPDPIEPDPKEGDPAKDPAQDTAQADLGESEWDVDGSMEFEDINVEKQLAEGIVEYGGTVRFEYFGYLKELDDEKIAARQSIDFALRAKAHVSNVIAAGTFLARHDFGDHGRDRIEAAEAYVQLDASPFVLKAGKRILSWGKTSLTNPTDIINPKDIRDAFETEKLGLWMLQLDLLLGSTKLEFLALPVFEPHLVPMPTGADPNGRLLVSSRWFDEVPNVTLTGIPIEYRFENPIKPSAKLAHAQGAFRFCASFWKMDLALGYAYLYDRIPYLRLDLTPSQNLEPSIQGLVHYDFQRNHVATFELEAIFGKLRLASELMLNIAEAYDVSLEDKLNPYLSAVFGLDYNTQLSGEHTIHVFIEGLVVQPLEGGLESLENDLRFPLRLAVLARMSYEIGSRFKLELNLAEALDRFDLIVNPKLVFVFSDVLVAEIGYQGFFGGGNGVLGKYNHNSRMTVGLEVQF